MPIFRPPLKSIIHHLTISRPTLQFVSPSCFFLRSVFSLGVKDKFDGAQGQLVSDLRYDTNVIVATNAFCNGRLCALQSPDDTRSAQRHW